MRATLLLDTHIALWLETTDRRLRPATKTLIDDCWRTGGTVFLSAVTAWEIASLIDRRRLRLDVSVERWVERFLDMPGLEGVEVSHHVAARSFQLSNLDHRDPADRLLIATAIDLGCPLVTYDERITAFAESAGRQHGFVTAT